MLFRNIALILSLEKPCYLENRVSGGVPLEFFNDQIQDQDNKRKKSVKSELGNFVRACILFHSTVDFVFDLPGNSFTSKEPHDFATLTVGHSSLWQICKMNIY